MQIDLVLFLGSWLTLKISNKGPNPTRSSHMEEVNSDPRLKVILILSSMLGKEMANCLTYSESTSPLSRLPSFILYEQQRLVKMPRGQKQAFLQMHQSSIIIFRNHWCYA